MPSVASINGMQVKDYLKDLQDENMITVEKIGSGNWYWSFGSDALKGRQNELAKLNAENDQLHCVIGQFRGEIGERESGAGEEEEKEVLRVKWESTKAEVEALRKELDSYRDGDPAEVMKKKKEIEGLKEKAERWTDNIYALETYVIQLAQGDRDALEGLRREHYGIDYVEGEGLREWT